MSRSLRNLYCVLGKQARDIGFRCVCSPKLNSGSFRRHYINTFLNCETNPRACVQAKRSKSSLKPTTDISFAARSTASNESERDQFLAVFPHIVKDLTDAGFGSEISEAKERFAKVLHYNVPGGKMSRGLAVVQAYRLLTKDSLHSAENVFLAHVMGWCVEMLQAFFIVLDDIMDKSATRRGRTCWYLHDDVGLSAVNDGLLLESGIYELLRRYFQDKSYYIEILNLFHDVTFKTTVGQSLDLLTSQAGKNPDYTKFTMDQYNAVVKYKTAYYSFYLPVALAMYMAGLKKPEAHNQAKAVLLEMGHFFQVQDDYLDCFGDSDVTGKVGSDIATGKCSWLAVTALQRANHQQQIVFKECYATDDEEKIAVIKELYDQLKLKSVFAEYEEQTYNFIHRNIQQLSHGLPHHLFISFLKKIYRRGS
ncbi:farnesyl pyrophosphate synthase-like [Schistocerca americana]|uniref:farnesyl pyrophosphate synthase-like n=1 Tax=Schistocerca americana TaxID=7009 RepID=UPI001F5009E0|nr:farnesyl pyrophosphate synthase-like [Schistocerca americana]